MWCHLQRQHRGDNILHTEWQASRYVSLTNLYPFLVHTRIEIRVGPAFEKDVKGRLYPVIGMTAPTAIVANFGSDIEKFPFKWELANSGKYDLGVVQRGKEDEPVTVQVPVEFGISNPPL